MLDVRSDFPVFQDSKALVYLDSAATAMKPKAVIDSITEGYAQSYATVHRGVYRRSHIMTERYEAARQAVAQFLGGEAGEIVFVRGATDAINLVAQSWGRTHLKAGDSVVISELEHHSNIVPWQILREFLGFTLKVIPITAQGDIDYDAAAKVIDSSTRLVAITHVSNVLGTHVDIPKIVTLAQAVGARVLVDGCQAVAHHQVDVRALGCDFYAFSAHKLYGPTGIGVLWGKKDVLADMPPVEGGGAMIESVTFDRSTFLPPPQRFEAGTPHIVGAIGLHAAIDYVQNIGFSRLVEHERSLAELARARLKDLFAVRVLAHDLQSSVLSFVMDKAHPHDIATILDEDNINIRAGHHCAQPLMHTLGVPATARVSFGVYNTIDDVERFAVGLQKVVRIFR